MYIAMYNIMYSNMVDLQPQYRSSVFLLASILSIILLSTPGEYDKQILV